jgi:signal transduction histidine kinase
VRNRVPPQDESELIARLRKRLEREKTARAEAEAIAETATAELYALNRMKTEFIATVSHELRTPLTSILGFAASLKRRELQERKELVEEAIDAIARNAERLHALIEQILSTSLFQVPDQDVRLTNFDFRVLTENLFEELDLRGCRLVLDVQEDLPRLDSDPAMVKQILVNLVDNAVKFSPPGGTCTLGAKADSNTFRFWVEDNGSGISPDHVKHIFEPFWQADSSTTRQVGGVGLGLHLARLIAQVLGGDIQVESEPNVRTRFSVVLRTRSSHQFGAASTG